MPPTQPVQPTQHPVLWLWDQMKLASNTVGAADGESYVPPAKSATDLPTVRHITIDDVKAAVAEGFEDFKAIRSDVIFLCIIYPIVGFVFASLAFGNLVQMLFPLAGGFALLGPLAAIGINELSRRRETGRARRLDRCAGRRAVAFHPVDRPARLHDGGHLPRLAVRRRGDLRCDGRVRMSRSASAG